MHLKLPPALVWFLAALLMFVVARFLPFGNFEFTGRVYLIYILVGLAALLGSMAIVQFFKKRTSINPTKPKNAAQLVTNGVYAYTRNPMYLGLLLMLLAWGLYLENAFNTLIAAGFVSYMNTFQIIPEEHALSKNFGTAYNAYIKNVRRWF
jgi:protein-S-isoprenylcysteine O-methyltransferase Ste14